MSTRGREGEREREREGGREVIRVSVECCLGKTRLCELRINKVGSQVAIVRDSAIRLSNRRSIWRCMKE